MSSNSSSDSLPSEWAVTVDGGSSVEEYREIASDARGAVDEAACRSEVNVMNISGLEKIGEHDPFSGGESQ